VTTASRQCPDPARGVFESLLVRDGRPVELGAHVARLGASVAGLYAQRVPAGIEELVAGGARGVRRGWLRLTVAPNGGAALATDVRVATVHDTLVFPAFSRAARLSRLVVPGGLGAYKWADRRLVQAAEGNGLVPLITDSDGAVLETSRANVFVVERGTIVTPPADGRILAGVTRQRVLELTAVLEESVSFERLLAADEVFLTGAVRGVEPVRACDGMREWTEGTLTPLVSDALRRRWEKEPRSVADPPYRLSSSSSSMALSRWPARRSTSGRACRSAYTPRQASP
jgi:para-aminobenzoate synthetase / 4-amino-4-deoxychorismate lyase